MKIIGYFVLISSIASLMIPGVGNKQPTKPLDTLLSFVGALVFAAIGWWMIKDAEAKEKDDEK